MGFVAGILKQEECNVLYEIWQIYVACQTSCRRGKDEHGSSKLSQKSNEMRKNPLKQTEKGFWRKKTNETQTQTNNKY